MSAKASIPTSENSLCMTSSTFHLRQKVLARQKGCEIWKNAVICDKSVRDGGVAWYYVHWLDQNRRMDEWVTQDRLRVSGNARRLRFSPDLELLNAPSMITRRRSKTLNVEKIQTPAYSQPLKKETYRLPKPPVRPRYDDRAKNVALVHFGDWILESWYYSPYPLLHPSIVPSHSTDSTKEGGRKVFRNFFKLQEPTNLNMYENSDTCETPSLHNYATNPPLSVVGNHLPQLYICEKCLKAHLSASELEEYHTPYCTFQHPPGNEIYRDTVQNILVFEVDGVSQPHYCERLCLLSRLFLEHKCVEWDTSPFLFYILAHVDTHGLHFLGYFAKEKNSPESYNLSCILILPPYQCRGFGRFLIELSYALSKREGVIGTPERPLSDLGLRSYRSYWRDTILDLILLWDANDTMDVSLNFLERETGISVRDIVETLRYYGVMDRPGSGKLYLSDKLRHDHFRRKALRRLKEKDHAYFDAFLVNLPQNDHLIEIAEQDYLSYRSPVKKLHL